MKIRLGASDAERLGIPEEIPFDFDRIGIREAAALQKATDTHPADIGEALEAEDLEVLAGVAWLAIGRALGKRPPWDTFDLYEPIQIIGDEPEIAEDAEAGKDDASGETTSNP
jgi:hypothetical protein